MRWSEGQQAQLRAMGLRIWQPGSGVADGSAIAAPEPLGAATPATRGAKQDQAPRRQPPPATLAATRPVPEHVPGAAQIGSPAEMDWPALQAAVAACTACALCRSRTQTVFGAGHRRAHWMIIGEAPGEQEDLRGEPFVGAAGRLLDRMLAALGLSREDADAEHQVYIANTLKCRPPRNRNPEADELARCLPFLERQVQLVQPRVILAMGRFAVQSLLGSSEPIGRLRGRIHSWRDRPLVVTYHPAYLLRQPAEKARAWADLCLAADLIERKLADDSDA